MNPWVAGRIIEQMQVEARSRAHEDRLAHQVAGRRAFAAQSHPLEASR